MNPKAQYIMYVFSMLLCYICIYYVIMSLSQKMFLKKSKKNNLFITHEMDDLKNNQTGFISISVRH